MFFLIDQPCTLSFPTGLVKTKSNFIVRLGRSVLMIAVNSVDAYPLLDFLDLTCHLKDPRIGVLWLHCPTR